MKDVLSFREEITVVMVTMEQIREGLAELGIRAGMKLEVHGSLKSFGKVDGGAATVIRALMDSVTENGSIVMPSFLMSPRLPLDDTDRSRGLTCKIRILSAEENTRSGMGTIADTFRTMPGVVTGDGLFRLSAWGFEKEINRNSLSNLIENNGYALLLGTDIYSLSSMHYMESAMPAEITRIFKPSDEVASHYPADTWFIETGEPPVKAWYKIQDEAFSLGYIKEARIGESRCMSFRIRDVTGLYRNALEADPFGLYGIGK
jgi:aminoglycoside N3'-acetyltransferase